MRLTAAAAIVVAACAAPTVPEGPALHRVLVEEGAVAEIRAVEGGDPAVSLGAVQTLANVLGPPVSAEAAEAAPLLLTLVGGTVALEDGRLAVEWVVAERNEELVRFRTTIAPRGSLFQPVTQQDIWWLGWYGAEEFVRLPEVRERLSKLR